MKTFSVKDSWREYEVDLSNFERLTHNKPPYYQDDPLQGGKPRRFALCPKCGNPVRLYGLYAEEVERSQRPHARHHGSGIEGLAEYDRQEYLHCPYADPDSAPAHKKRPADHPRSSMLYDLMREQFDRIVYIWGKTTGLKMGTAFAEDQLRQWRADESWRYYIAAPDNLPYLLMYGKQACPLYGRIIESGSPAHNALARVKHLKLDPQGNGNLKVLPAGSTRFLADTFTLEGRIPPNDSGRPESFKLVFVSAGGNAYAKAKIEVEPAFLTNLLDLPPERQHRNQKLLEIAERILA